LRMRRKASTLPPVKKRSHGMPRLRSENPVQADPKVPQAQSSHIQAALLLREAVPHSSPFGLLSVPLQTLRARALLRPPAGAERRYAPALHRIGAHTLNADRRGTLRPSAYNFLFFLIRRGRTRPADDGKKNESTGKQGKLYLTSQYRFADRIEKINCEVQKWQKEQRKQSIGA